MNIELKKTDQYGMSLYVRGNRISSLDRCVWTYTLSYRNDDPRDCRLWTLELKESRDGLYYLTVYQQCVWDVEAQEFLTCQQTLVVPRSRSRLIDIIRRTDYFFGIADFDNSSAEENNRCEEYKREFYVMGGEVVREPLTDEQITLDNTLRTEGFVSGDGDGVVECDEVGQVLKDELVFSHSYGFPTFNDRSDYKSRWKVYNNIAVGVD